MEPPSRTHAGSLPKAVRIASLPGSVRGYEHRKVARAEEYHRDLAAALANWPV